ncbi:MAG: 50S ribosomal protein L9 [Euryhalocaulis sp.]|uniref:50S ribosomal protein L9 n=1 Tax=Euryhalocaulis sp. TaxID=2744307 RepID=UPI0017FADA03|nr:50S ribosomal protein L9 [Euryhalocaulis sp.]MBA4800264.1 50S ribosomal protein L9 [Euryhalocaulis sp.]
MEVVLLERVENLGGMGEVVRVKPGYARNFLLPQNKALRATKANIERFERERDALEKLNDERKTEAQTDADKIDGKDFILIRQAGDTGQLYGSVSSRDIADAVTGEGHKVARSQVKLDIPIKTIGVYEIEIRLHPEVSATIRINVARTADEAERQAEGEDIIAAERDEDRAAAIAEKTGLSEEEAAEIFEEGAEPEDLAAAEGDVEGEGEEAEAETAEADAEDADEVEDKS